MGGPEGVVVRVVAGGVFFATLSRKNKLLAVCDGSCQSYGGYVPIAALLSMGLVWQHGESAEKHARNLKAHARLLLRHEELINLSTTKFSARFQSSLQFRKASKQDHH